MLTPYFEVSDKNGEQPECDHIRTSFLDVVGNILPSVVSHMPHAVVSQPTLQDQQDLNFISNLPKHLNIQLIY